MDKEKKDTKKQREGKDMPVTANSVQADTFAEFLTRNKLLIRHLAEANTKRNQEGKTVISKNDPWREEHEWNKANKE